MHLILQWRHNECDGISNHRRLDGLLNRLFWHRSKKTSKLQVTAICEGNSPVNSEFPSQRASNAENVSIWSWNCRLWNGGHFVPGQDYISATGAIIWLGECHVLPCETTTTTTITTTTPTKSFNGEIKKQNFKKSCPFVATNRISGVTYSHHAEKAILFWPMQCMSCNIGIDEYFVACQPQIIPRRSIGFPMTALVCLGVTQFNYMLRIHQRL